jgi:hypothetical protein
MTDDLTDLAAELYIYGFALVFNVTQINRFVNEGLGALPKTGLNNLAHGRDLAGPNDTFVSINNDTVYSTATLDLSAGPLRLDLPDSDDRYYVMQFVDAWTNNFAYLGRRATGTAAGSYLIVGPGHQGELPPADGVIRSPTRIAVIVGRWAVDGKDDLPAVHALQDRMALTQLDRNASPEGIPEPATHMPDDMRFLDQLRTWSQAFPAAAEDREYEQRFAVLHDADEDTLRAGLQKGKEQLEATLARSGGSPTRGGWIVNPHVFDYNNDFFEIGALSDPQWRIADRAQAALVRTLAARGGLWGNHGYEAIYCQTYTDSGGEPLTGEHRYTLTFAGPLPVDAFWSVTMYDLPEFYLVANPIERYSIGDRTPGLRYGDDGSLEIVIQHDDPGGDESANWLPAPSEQFRPLLRMYQPQPAAFADDFTLPSIVRRD